MPISHGHDHDLDIRHTIVVFPSLAVACLLSSWHGFGREFYHEMCLSKLPRDAVPLSAEDEAAWVDSIQMYGGERRMGAVTPGETLGTLYNISRRL